jgi:sigma-B regulation protein RsbU (phosphoserine phosphatase)
MDSLPPAVLDALRDDLVQAAVAFILLGIALAAGLLAALRRRTEGVTLASFATFCAIYACRALGDTNAARILFGFSLLELELFTSVLTYLVPIPALLFFTAVLGRGWKSSLFRIWQISIVFSAVAIPFEVLTRSPEAFGLPYRVLTLTGVSVSVLHLFLPRLAPPEDLWLLRASFLLLSVFVILENLRAMGLLPLPEGLEPVGVLLFIFGLGWIAARRLFDSQQRLAALRQELETARRIQASILPAEPPQIAGLDIAMRYVPAADVAGDFYDVLPGEGRQLGLLVADVSGHGVPAALIASMVKVAAAAQAPHAASPARVLTEMNRIFQLKSQFITAVYAWLDLDAGRLTWASAGHPPPLLWKKRDGTVQELLRPGMVLGRLRRAAYTEASVPLEPGDRLLLFTDGIPEALNAAGEPFGDARLRKILAEASDLAADALADRLLQRVAAWTGRSAGFEDDLTLVVAGVETR